MSRWVFPTLDDAREASRRIAPYLPRTALYRHPSLDDLTGGETWVKHENHLPTGAFKVRGGVNLMAKLGPEERTRPVIGASTGNHGQSIAYAAQLFDMQAIICVPEECNPVKLAAMEQSGAEVVRYGADFDDAREYCQKLAEAKDYRYIHSGNEPDLIAGVGTYALEVLDELPDANVFLVPVGGGSGAAGTAIAVKAVRPEAQVIGVQSSAAPAAWRSWKEGTLVEDRMGTAAEGLATRTAFELPQLIMRELLDDFVLVDEDQLWTATFQMIEKTRNLVEPAGAAALAAAMSPSVQERWAGKKIVLIASGGNLTPAQLRTLLDRVPG